ncbi:MAG: FtsQ-type POTRA domain-containing protein [Bacteroidota bacterium]
MKRITKILTWIAIAAWFVLIMGFVSGQSEEVLCNRIEVILDDTLDNRFVTPGDIRSIVESSGSQLQGYPLSGINTRELEQLIEKNLYIRNAEVSKEISGKLEVQVEQRVPLVRIMPEGERGFYLDREGVVLPLSDQFSPLIMLASGHISNPGPEGEMSARLMEIHSFCSYLSGHEFWSDQVVQLYVNSKGEYELIPRVGAHQILLGSLDEWERKLHNLELLYVQGLSRKGWNSYETINLKYTNQVICTKR